MPTLCQWGKGGSVEPEAQGDLTISGRGMVRGGIKASNLDFPQESPGECLSPEWLWENFFALKLKIRIQASMHGKLFRGKSREISMTLDFHLRQQTTKNRRKLVDARKISWLDN